jgi:predicted dehydrogenase
VPIRVGVVGAGHLGVFHARCYSRNQDCVLIGVADVIGEKAGALAAEVGCRAFSSHRDLIGKVDAVSVASPTTSHEEIAREMLDAGISVLVEKPLAQDKDAGARIVATARERGRVLAVGQIERCNPAFRAARPDLCAPRFIESHRLATFVPRSIDVDVILDLMIHDIDLVLSLAKSPLVAVDAIGVPVITAEADIANARLRFEDGCVANLTASRVSSQKMRKIRFFERNLYLSIDLASRRLERVRLVPLERDTSRAAEGADPETAFLAEKGLRLERGMETDVPGDALSTEIQGFLDACVGTGPAIVTGEEGLRSLEVALSVRSAVLSSLSCMKPGIAP